MKMRALTSGDAPAPDWLNGDHLGHGTDEIGVLDTDCLACATAIASSPDDFEEVTA